MMIANEVKSFSTLSWLKSDFNASKSLQLTSINRASGEGLPALFSNRASIIEHIQDYFLLETPLTQGEHTSEVPEAFR